MTFSIMPCHRVFLLPLADKRIQQTIFHPHPLPAGSPRNIDRWLNLIFQLTGCRVNKLTGFVVSDVQNFRRSNYRIAMNHQPRRELFLPKYRTVIAVKCHKRIKKSFLSLLERDMTEHLKNPPARSNRQLRHRCITRVSHKLSQIGRSRNLVLRLRIVVRPIIRMAPVVNTRRHRFD